MLVEVMVLFVLLTVECGGAVVIVDGCLVVKKRCVGHFCGCCFGHCGVILAIFVVGILLLLLLSC